MIILLTLFVVTPTLGFDTDSYLLAEKIRGLERDVDHLKWELLSIPRMEKDIKRLQDQVEKLNNQITEIEIKSLKNQK